MIQVFGRLRFVYVFVLVSFGGKVVFCHAVRDVGKLVKVPETIISVALEQILVGKSSRLEHRGGGIQFPLVRCAVLNPPAFMVV